MRWFQVSTYEGATIGSHMKIRVSKARILHILSVKLGIILSIHVRRISHDHKVGVIRDYLTGLTSKVDVMCMQ